MFTFLLVLQIIVSISIISLVLLQQGKGADMGAAFGSGASGTVFGARGSGSFFSRATGILAAVFFINCLLIASPLVRETVDETGSVVDRIEQQQAATEAAARQEQNRRDVTDALEKLEGQGPDDLPADIPASAEPAAEATNAPDTATTADVPEDVPATAGAPDAAEDLPE
jgi:preprotein translocase subunit SecG